MTERPSPSTFTRVVSHVCSVGKIMYTHAPHRRFTTEFSFLNNFDPRANSHSTRFCPTISPFFTFLQERKKNNKSLWPWNWKNLERLRKKNEIKILSRCPESSESGTRTFFSKSRAHVLLIHSRINFSHWPWRFEIKGYCTCTMDISHLQAPDARYIVVDALLPTKTRIYRKQHAIITGYRLLRIRECVRTSVIACTLARTHASALSRA